MNIMPIIMGSRNNPDKEKFRIKFRMKNNEKTMIPIDKKRTEFKKILKKTDREISREIPEFDDKNHRKTSKIEHKISRKSSTKKRSKIPSKNTQKLPQKSQKCEKSEKKTHKNEFQFKRKISQFYEFCPILATFVP